MAYTKMTDFSVKDTLLTGNPLKVVRGTEIDDEFDAISTAIGVVSPSLTADLPVFVNGAGTAFEVISASSARTKLAVAALAGSSSQTFATDDLNAAGTVTSNDATNGFVTDATYGYVLFAASPSGYNLRRSGTDIILQGPSTIIHNVNGTTIATTSSTGQAVVGNITSTAKISATTGMAVGGATAGTGGIAFPATAVAVADANTLDDYEEGTWTPTQGAGLTMVGAFSSSGTYTKVGRKVTVTGKVIGATSVAASTGQAICGGLPFTILGDTSVGSTANNSLSVGQGCYGASTTLYLAGPTIAATPVIYFTITYFV